ncbi:flagella basal body P-ring formation protein FlgA [Thermocrinis albus DSM 14484]|uniref:Flagella basal body P-ring formation protein FlgA n=1 Tax=Thermocrinis albus (strain DSM 14484 / JCM 11386 / HI 11/12) TaxID=638303 RepID=D3SMC6_THEAH|nr:flagellar basal body P-ring formation chaperone FlgA [Thermocrinis albus]ADC89906.1 flagella basal body P-ring formation protein FlgA [Thermocrinis albus DSM 14484]
MLVLWMLILFSVVYGEQQDILRERVLSEIKRKFGDDFRLTGVRYYDEIPQITDGGSVYLDMEYGRGKMLAYLVVGDRRYTLILDGLWRYTVLIAKEDIPKGRVLKPDMFYKEERWGRSVPSDLRLEDIHLSQYITSTFIPKGSIIRRSLLKPIPAVEIGQTVEAFYTSGNLELKFHARSLDRGYIGKTVRVLPEGKKNPILRAKVIAPGKVQILY